MTDNNSQRKLNYQLIASLAIIIVLFLTVFFFFKNIVIYIFIASVIAAIGRPITNYFSKSPLGSGRVMRVVSVIITFSILFLSGIALIVLFVPLIRDQIIFISSLDFTQIQAFIGQPLEYLEEFLLKYELTTHEEKGFLIENFFQGIKNFLKKLNYSIVIEGVLSFTGNLFTGALAIMFTSFFLLYEKGMISNILLKVIPNSYFELSLSAYYRIQRLLSNYLLGLVLQMLAIFSFSALALILFDIEHALTIALFAAVSNLIPYAGPLLGAIFGIITSTLTLTVLESNESIYPIFFKIIVIFIIVQLIDNILIQPIVFSKSVKAHPLEIFVIVVAGATTLGVIGMIIAIPVYTALKVFVQEILRGFKNYRAFRA